MANPEKGLPGKLGIEGKGNARPNDRPDIRRPLGSLAIRGTQGR